MAKIVNDKYYTKDNIAKYCVSKTFEILGTNWDRIIEPSAGNGSFLEYLPNDTLAYDIAPEGQKIIPADYREVKLPYVERSLVIGNPPFGRANKLSIQFIKASLLHSPYISFIQPISQLNQNRTMKDTELLYSEDLGNLTYSGRRVHCCLNIYHFCKDGHRQNFDIPGILECRHIFRTGKYKHSDEILNYPWDFRVAAWGTVRLLNQKEFCPNEVVFRCDNNIRGWLGEKLTICDYKNLLQCVASPNLPAWRLKKWLKEQWEEENDTNL